LLTTKILNTIGTKSLLIDTNFLIDALRHSDEFRSLIDVLKNKEVKLSTSEFVLLEFFKGIDTKQHFVFKKNLYEKLSVIIHSSNEEFFANTSDMLFVYRKQGMSLDATDLYLSGMLKKLQKESLLLTRNHSDFPTTLFDRVGVINVELETTILSYSLLKFSREKYSLAVDNFLKSK